MTNSAIQSLLDTNGDKLFAIFYDNNITELFGYSAIPETPMERIKLIGENEPLNDGSSNITSDELIEVSNKMNFGGTELPFKMIHTSESVQWVGVMQETSKEYRPDPIVIKGW